jgi:hypothetical protein
LQASYPILDIQIVGINEFGQDPPGANELMIADRTTPWLQDVDSNANQVSDVWYDLWDVTYRDVIILNGQNEMVEVFNLTPPEGFDLGVAENYAALHDKLVDAAMTEQTPWQNHRDRYDVNDDGFVVPRDVLIMINEINANGPLELPPPTGTSLEAPFWDCSGDNFFSPVDILQVINFIEGVDAEGESKGASKMELTTLSAALPAAESLSMIELESIAARIVDVAPEENVEPATPVLVAQSDDSTDERFRPTELIEDDFWAGYWPSL